jgi:outer membrane biosynthesis protein TonB
VTQTSIENTTTSLSAIGQLTGMTARKWMKRVVFFLLAIWLHCALLFFLVMHLFKGHEDNPQSEANATQHQVVDVHLQPPTPPKDDAVIPAAPAPPTITPQASVPIPVDEALKAAKEVENPSPDKPVERNAEEHGILSCSSLTKKPERIVFGEDKIPYTAEDGPPSGYVILRETIGRQGNVINVAIDESTMTKKLEERAITWARQKLYFPGEIGGVAVDCELRYMVSATQP